MVSSILGRDREETLAALGCISTELPRLVTPCIDAMIGP